MSSKLSARAISLLGVITLLAAIIVVPPQTTANHMVDLTVTVSRIADLGGDLDDGAADLYVAVVIDGQVFHSFNNIAVDVNTRTFTPALSFTKSVPLVRSDDRPALIPVSFSVWDNDTCGEPFCDDQFNPFDNDDKGDTKNGPGDEVTIFVDPIAGTWSGDLTSPTACSTGELGSNQSEVCWGISTGAVDSDGDGLLDDWEVNGLDLNHSFPPEVNLPLMGADPNVPDIFLELDYTAGQTPARDDIRAMVRAFAASGIRLHVDMGDLIDVTAVEGQAEGTCMDGIDNNADGQTDGADTDCFNQPGTRQYLETSTEDPPPPLASGANTCGDGIDNDGINGADGADPSCRVSDFFDFVPDGGGPILDNTGTPVPSLNNCGLDAAFYAAKNGSPNFSVNFNPNRRWVFRYAISTANDVDTDGAGSDTDTCSIGGQGEIGGNDFIEYNHDGGTIMHELGHNLKLQHGGDDSVNCEPNYVSSMNYDHQFGIPRVGGGAIIDFSPPRINVDGTSRGVAPLGQLDETDLDETVVLDATDGANRFIFSRMNTVTGVVDKITTDLDVRPNWNGDADTTDTSVPMNINLPGIPPGSPAGTAPSPPACATVAGMPNPNNETLDGFNDWNALVLPFLQYGDSLTRSINSEEDNVPNMQDRDVLLAAINTADVHVTIADNPEPVGAGERLTYTLTAGNTGPNPASSVQVTTTLPADVVFVDTSVPCVRAGNVVTCNLGEILPGATRTYTIRVDVPADLVYNNGGPKTITATTAVDNLAGPDPNTANDTDSEDTLVITKADIKITNVTTTSPLEVLIGQPASATLDVTVENGGPSTPVDTTLTGTATPDAGLTVTPASQSADQIALVKDTLRTVSQTFALDCVTPGFKTVEFDYAITHKDPTAVDPDLSNNEATVSFTIDCVVPIAINVRPKGFPNSINLNTDATLAALTTQAGEYGLPLSFDATTIDPLSVRWGLRGNLFNVASASGASEIHNKGHIERSYELDEKTRDADLDMVLHFKPAASGLTAQTTEACLKGSFTASNGSTYRFLGCDSVRIVPR